MDPTTDSGAAPPVAYEADQGAKFASDVHRRVLGHLSLPSDPYGWVAADLFKRLSADLHETFTQDRLNAVLNELAKEGHAEAVNGTAWRMTDAGYAAITEQPPAGAGTPRPVTIGAATPIGRPVEGKATPLSVGT